MFESQPLNDSPSPSSLMASSSSSSSRTWKYDVFASLHGLDVPKTYVHHICKQLNYNGITMFDDQGIERGQTTSPALTEAIRESRISIVVLSKNYASSSLCLDELLEILKCKENFGQIVMPVFYRVDPSHVRKQTGDFGIAFNETCARKTQEERRRWSQALNYVSNIAGEHSLNWDNESEMIEKIFQDISYKLNTTISRDFGNIVGLQTHMEMMRSLLHIDNEDQAMIVFDPSSSNNRIGKGKHRCSTGMAVLVVINLLVEIASAVAEQLSSIRKPYFARISLVMSTLSVVFSILDLTYKIQAHKARFKCKWPIPWFYYPSRGYNRIFGNFTDTVLLFCVVGGLIVATVNWSYIDKRRDGPIKVSIWPLLFAIGMVASKFMEKPAISRDNLLYLE